jgi:hypothetical protein
VFTVLMLPNTFIFFLSPGKGGLAIGIVMATLAVSVLSAFFGLAIREALRHRDRITVTSEAVTFRRWGDGRETTFRREDGDLLLVIPKDFQYASAIDLLLTQLGTGKSIGLWHFPRGAVRRACNRRGWRFGYDPDLGERQLRIWRDRGSRDRGWLTYAASLVVARGPVNVAADPGGHVSLGAAILDEYAAGLPQGRQDHQGYRRAVPREQCIPQHPRRQARVHAPNPPAALQAACPAVEEGQERGCWVQRGI